MYIDIIAVGKIKEKYLTEGIREYLKRLGGYAKVNIIETADEKLPDPLSAAKESLVKQKEGERILGHIREDAYVIALNIHGQQWTSEQFAEKLGELATCGRSRVAFIIGGSVGLDHRVLKRADVELSFGKMTYPHQLMRLILLEQIYRAFKIMRGEPYHK